MPAFDPEAFDLDAFESDSVAHATVTVDHAEGAVDRLPQQFKNKPKIDRFLRLLVKPLAEIEQAIADMNAFRTLDTAVGEQLQILRRLVVQQQIDLDDESLRSVLKAKIKANRSSGTGNEILRIARLVLESYARTVELSGVMRLKIRGAGVASYVLEVLEIDVPWQYADLLMSQFLREIATATGVRANLHFTPFQDPTTDNHTRAFQLSHGEPEDSVDQGWGSVTTSDVGGLLTAVME